ncbi:MAG: hypothetical protein JXR85_04635 [Deltaproteobacteria bacterium]|nr:hypothetical protein [Deltaproteobacteria bacterium]
MQYLVIAYDGTDSEAPGRRLKVREAHLENVKAMKAAGTFLTGGAILNEAGGMIGSALFVEFDTEAALNEWLKNDPYVTGGVWVDINVKPVRIVSL